MSKGKRKVKVDPCVKEAGLADVDTATYLSVDICEHGAFFLRLHRPNGDIFAGAAMTFDAASWLSSQLATLAMRHAQRMAQLKAASDQMGETKGSA